MNKKIFLASSLFSILFILTACGGAPEQPVRQTAYSIDFTEFDIEGGYSISASAKDKELFQIIDRNLGRSELYLVGYDGQFRQVGSLSEELMDDSCRIHDVYSLQPGTDGGTWLFVSASGTIDKYFLYHLDGDGEQTGCLDLSAAVAETGLAQLSLPQVSVDSDGWVYLQNEGKVYVIDKDLSLRFSLDTGPHSGGAVLLADGRVAVPVLLSGKPGEPAVYELRTIARETGDWDAVYSLPESAEANLWRSRFYSGGGGSLFFAACANTLYSWNTEAGNYEVILDDSSGMSLDGNNVACVTVGEEGRIFILSSRQGKTELAALTPADASQLPEKKILTLGTIVADLGLTGLVADFNKSSQEYRIQIKEYGQPVDEGLMKLNIDIASGKIPDLLCVDRLPVEQYGEKGLLEDLWPYIDSDPEVGRERLMDHALECAQQDGKLYMVFNGFSINTTVGAAAVVGERMSWTLADLQAALEQMPEGCLPCSPSDCKRYFLMDLINADLERYIDWSAGKCFFDGEEFRELLSFVDSLDIAPEERGSGIYYQESDILAGKQMLYTPAWGIGNFFELQKYEALFDGPVSLIGYPSDGICCGSSFDVMGGYPIAITTACTDLEGAWAFLRTLLLPRGVDESKITQESAFPINREDFDQLVQISMAERGDDEVKIGYSFNRPEGEVLRRELYRPVTQAEYDQVMELYEAIDHVYAEAIALWDIISEQASRFFAGEGTLEQAAEAIQSRAELYMNEQA